MQDKILERLETINDTVTDVRIKLAETSILVRENAADLAEHMRRSDAAENRLDHLEDTVLPEITRQLTEYRTAIKTLTWVVSGVVGFFGVLRGALEVWARVQGG